MTRTWLNRMFPPARTVRRGAAPVGRGFVTLEDRATPALFYVDPAFALALPGDTATFNAGKPNEQTGVIVGRTGFADLATAIDTTNKAAGADTIFLSDGTHDVDPAAAVYDVLDPLTLTGSGTAATTIKAISNTADDNGNFGAVFYVGQTKLDVSNLTFDGNGVPGVVVPPGAARVGSAFRYDDATGSVTNVTVKNVIRDTPTINHGIGVVAIGPLANVAVTGSRFENMGRTGVNFYGGATGSVSGSTFVGRPSGITIYGVEVVEGSKNVLITGSTFTGFDGTSTTDASAAIQVSDNLGDDGNLDGNNKNDPASAVIIGNSISGGQDGIIVGVDPAVDTSTVVVQFNTIQGNTDFGILTDTTTEVNSLFNFYGDPSGPAAAGNKTASGDSSGTGNAVDINVLYSDPTLTPNGAVLVVAPPTSSVAVTPGGTLTSYAAAAATQYKTQTNFDSTRPVPAVTAPTPLPQAFATKQFTATVAFGEAVTGFDASDITVGGTAANPAVVSVAAGATAGTFTVVLSVAGPGTLTIAVPAAAAKDATGNASTALAPVTLGTADFTAPTLTITTGTGAALPAAFADPLTFTFTYSEPVTGFDRGDVLVGGTAAGGSVQSVVPSADGTTYTVVVGGFTSPGDVTLRLSAGAAADLAGNPTAAAGPITAATGDSTPPTVSIGIPAVELPVPFADPLAFIVTFSEPVTGFTAADVQIGGSATGGRVSNVAPNADGSAYTITLSGFASKGDVSVSVPAGAAADLAGNASVASGRVQIATGFDQVAPIVMITGDGRALPQAYADPITLTFTFSEPVFDFSVSDVVIGGTAVGGRVTRLEPTNLTNSAFSVVIGGFTTPGSVTVQLPAGAVADALGNLSLDSGVVATANAPTTPPVPPPGGDVTPPTAAVTSPAGALPVTFAANPVTLTVTFSEAVTGFTAGDIVLGGTATGGKVQDVTASADGKTYAVTVGGFVGRGTITVAIPTGAAADAAGNASTAVAAVSAGSFVPPFSRGFAVGGDRLAGAPFYLVDENFKSQTAVVPFGSAFAGGVRVASADVDGDGTLDTIVGTGVGIQNEVVVYSGRNNGVVLTRFNPFEATFTGGTFVAGADLNGDGKAEIIVTPDETGGPRVDVYSGAGFGKLASFFGIDDANFRGGARPGTGDVNGDGTPDLIVSAGFGGGPRLAIYDGKQVSAGTPVKIAADFFGYEDTLRNGAFVTAGDVNNDGFADVILGAGPGGGPRVRVLDGKALLGGTQTQVANFFAGADADRGGVRVTTDDLDGDGVADIVTGAGQASGSRVRVYYGSAVAAGTPVIGKELNLFGDFSNGVFVG